MDAASLDVTAAAPTWTGIVRYLHRTPRAFLPMKSFPSLTLVAGQGIEGDRYMIGQEAGFYSHKPEEGRQVTLFEIETLEALARDAKITLLPEEHRRNVTVQGVPLNHLVGPPLPARRGPCWRRPACRCRAGTSRRSPARRSSTPSSTGPD